MCLSSASPPLMERLLLRVAARGYSRCRRSMHIGVPAPSHDRRPRCPVRTVTGPFRVSSLAQVLVLDSWLSTRDTAMSVTSSQGVSSKVSDLQQGSLGTKDMHGVSKTSSALHTTAASRSYATSRGYRTVVPVRCCELSVR